MKEQRQSRQRRWILVIAVLMMTSMACGLITNAVESLVERGSEALFESGGIEDLIISGLMNGEESIDLSELEYPQSEFLFEIDPFDDIIRWRFYAADASIDQTSDFYRELLPDYSVTYDEMMNGYRYFVLSSGHPLSSIYTEEQLIAAKASLPVAESALLDIEVLNATAHADVGRLGIAGGFGLLPSPPPTDTTLIIVVYNVSNISIGDVIDPESGIQIPGFPDDSLTDDDGDADDDSGRNDENGDLFEDDEDWERTITDQELTNMCSQVLGSGACYHPYIPVAEGFSREYTTADGRIIETISEVWENGFTVTTTTSDGGSFSSNFECDQGNIIGWGVDESVLAMVEGNPGGFTEVDIEGIPLPANISPGDSWQVTVTMTIGVVVEGVESKNVIVLDVDYSAVGEETINISAGTFNAMRIDFSVTGNNTLVVTGPGGSLTQPLVSIDSTGSEWYVDCLGKVKSTSQGTITALMAGMPNVDHDSTMEATGFRLK